MTATAIPAVVALRPPVAARRLLTAYFAGMGALMAVWGARMPAVQAVAHLSTGQLSIVLLAAAVGMVAGLQAGGIWAHRHGPARLLTAPAVGLALVLVLLGQGRTLPELATLALLFGLVHGVLDVGANAAAVRCQDRYRRPIMSSLHCGYSAGALCGAALAALTAHLAHSVVFAVFGITAALAALVAAPATRNIADLGTETHQSHASTQPPPPSTPAACCGFSAGSPRPASSVKARQRIGQPSMCTTSAARPRSLPPLSPRTAPPWPQAASSATVSPADTAPPRWSERALCSPPSDSAAA